MNFYDDWNNAIMNSYNPLVYCKDFLSRKEESLKIFYEGNLDELYIAVKFLNDLPMDYYLDILTILNAPEYDASDIIQYSNFEHAIVEIPKILEVVNDMLTFDQLGYKLIGSRTIGAQKKYGENHSKLAAECDFVYFQRIGSTYIHLTNLGKLINSLDVDFTMQLVRRLLLRNKFIICFLQHLIIDGKCNYLELARTCLSETTSRRRLSNIKFIINLILKGTKYEKLLDNITWD